MAQVLLRGVLLLCGLLLAALARAQVNENKCAWDSVTDPNQGLDPKSFENGARQLTGQPGTTTEEGCQKACCQNADCQVAMVGMPADGTAECFLVSCVKDGQNVCILQPDSQFKVYIKDTQSKSSDKIEAVGLGYTQNTDKAGDNSTDRCAQPKRVGPCRASFPKYFYDTANQTCSKFLYGGCGANGNNFETLEACQTACVNGTAATVESEVSPSAGRSMKLRRLHDQEMPRDAPQPRSVTEEEPKEEPKEDPDVVYEEPYDEAEEFHPDVPHLQLTADKFAARCEVSPKAGPCRASFQRWYYDSSAGQCLAFLYGGCHGNQNNYFSQESCMAACQVTVIPKSRKVPGEEPKDEVTKEYREACMVEAESGPCRAAFPMFYFQHSTGTCQSFIYGGCKGNKNAYATLEECMSRCGGEVQGHGNKGGLKRWTPAFFLVATLAVISALLLASLIVMTLRRTRLHRRSSHSDKEELLPEHYEEPSVHSLALEEAADVGRA